MDYAKYTPLGRMYSRLYGNFNYDTRTLIGRLCSRLHGGSIAGGWPFAPSNYGLRMFEYGSGVANVNDFGWLSVLPIAGETHLTTHLCVDAEAPFDAVQLVFGTEIAGTYPILGASVAPGATLDDTQNGSAAGRANFTQVTFGGANTLNVVGSGVNFAPTYTISDEIPCVSVPRAAGDAATWSVAGGKLADSYSRPLLHVRVVQAIANGVATPLVGNRIHLATVAGRIVATPVGPTLSGRIAVVRNAAHSAPQLSVGAATALSGRIQGPFTAQMNVPFVGIIFKYRGRAMSIMPLGDSITAGGTSYRWSTFAQNFASTEAQPIDSGYGAVAGLNSTGYKTILDAMIAGGLSPTVVCIPSVSPNDGTTGAVSTANIDAMITACLANNIYPMMWTGLPSLNFDNTRDASRVALNNLIRAGTAPYSREFMEMELPSLTNGATPKAAIPNPTYSTDGIHPNTAGEDLMRAQATAKYQALAALYFS